MLESLYLIFIALSALGLGLRALALLRLTPPDLARQGAYGLAFGLGLLGFGMLAFAALQQLRVVNTLLLLIGGALFGAAQLGALWRAARQLPKLQFRPWMALGGGLLGLHLLINFISAFNPPIDLDVLAYHLSLPKIFLQNNAVLTRPDIVYSNWPLHGSMLFMLGLQLQSDLLAQLIAFLISLSALWAVWACARPHVAPPIAALAAFIFYTIPVVGYEASIAYVDVALALYAMLAWGALHEWLAGGHSRWLWLSALMAGFAPAFKLSGAFVPAILTIGVLIRPGSLWSRLKWAGLYGALAFSVVFPWLLKTHLQTGNPLTPYLYEWLGARLWTDSAAAQTQNLFHHFGMGRDLMAILLLPWNITMYSSLFGGGNLGPLFLAALPLWWLARPWPNFIKSAALVLLGYLVFWFALVQEVRFLIPILPMLSVITAYVLISWAHHHLWARRAIIGLVAFTGIANLILLGTNFARPPGSIPPTKSLAVIFGQETREAYLSRVERTYGILAEANALPQASRVLLLGLGENYYLNRDFIRGFPVAQPFFDAFALGNAAAIAQQIQILGVTHLILNIAPDTGEPFYAAEGPPEYAPAMQQYLAQHGHCLVQRGEYALYAVQP